MTSLLSPFVYWAQSEKNVYVKIDLKDVKGPTVKLEKRKLEFESTGVGAHGSQNYGFSLDFYSEIDTEESSCKVHDSKIDFNIVKEKKGWWPRLTSKPQKPAWLKIDFDRWQSEEDLNSEDEKLRDVREDYADLYSRLQKDEFGYAKENLKKVYLVIYNLLMFVGFVYVVSVLGVRYLRDGIDCFPGTYEAVGTAIRYLHVLQLSEIILAAVGFTSGGILAPLMQVGGRFTIIFCLIDPEPRLQIQPVIFYLYLVWSAVELIRYPFYITQICKIELYYLTWLRYTIWIILYPLGFSTEATVIYKSIPYLEETGRFSYSLPNEYNFTFSLPTFLRLFLLFFLVPTAYVLMSHMYRARIKKIGSKSGMKVK